MANLPSVAVGSPFVLVGKIWDQKSTDPVLGEFLDLGVAHLGTGFGIPPG
jgi:hypothetical protein